MFFNEYAVYQSMKQRQEETEKIARNAWKFEKPQSMSFLQKLRRKWNFGQKSCPVQTNCSCACC
jgi:hypothetical protein